MLNNTKKIIVGFSGGADSSALLHFLFVHASNFGKNFIVEAVHINHNLRGEESLRDELSSKELSINRAIYSFREKIKHKIAC